MSLVKVTNTRYKLTHDNTEYEIYIASENGNNPDVVPVWFIDYIEKMPERKYIHGHPYQELSQSMSSDSIDEKDVLTAALNILTN